MQYRGGPQSPVTDLQLAVNEIAHHARKIVAYNAPAEAEASPVDAVHLQALIQEQLNEREDMAQRVADHLGRALPVGHDTYLLVDAARHENPACSPGLGRAQP